MYDNAELKLISDPIFNTFIENIYNDPYNAELLFTPLEKDLGTTLGNALRRIILGYTSGYAITSLEINNVFHEFDYIPGMKEDIIHLISNLKLLSIEMNNSHTSYINLVKRGPSIVLSSDINCPNNVRILNNDLYICTLNQMGYINIKMRVDKGIGYIPSLHSINRTKYRNALVSNDFNHGNLNNSFRIPIDTVFSPVTHVCYYVKHFSFYEELLLHIQTNGSISPIQVVKDSLAFLRKKI